MQLQNIFEEFKNKNTLNKVTDEEILRTFKIASDTAAIQTLKELKSNAKFQEGFKDFNDPKLFFDENYMNSKTKIVVNENQETLLDVFSRYLTAFLKKVSLEMH